MLEHKEKERGESDAEYINRKLSISKEQVEVLSKITKKKCINRWVWSTRKYKTLYVEKVLKKVFNQFGNKSNIL